MTMRVIADLVATIRSRGPRSSSDHSPEEDYSREGHRSGDDHGSGRGAGCVVVTCPECGGQRPYRVQRDDSSDGGVPYQVEQGIGLHLRIRHDVEGVEREEQTSRILSAAEHRTVSGAVLDEVESRNRKWGEYRLNTSS